MDASQVAGISRPELIEGLPAGLTAYKRTPVFDEQSLPAGLKRSHSTKAGVWGVIHIISGELLYRIIEPFSERRVDAASPRVVIQPQELHEVTPLGAVRFYVEFHAIRDVSS